MFRSFVFAFTVLLSSAGIAVAASPPPSVEVKLDPQHGSTIPGTATISHGAKTIDVTVVLDGVFIPENEYPAGIYAGTCAALAAKPAYPLAPVVGGRSVTHFPADVMKRHPAKARSYALAVFNTRGTQTTACGMLPAMHHEGSTK